MKYVKSAIYAQGKPQGLKHPIIQQEKQNLVTIAARINSVKHMLGIEWQAARQRT